MPVQAKKRHLTRGESYESYLSLGIGCPSLTAGMRAHSGRTSHRSAPWLLIACWRGLALHWPQTWRTLSLAAALVCCDLVFRLLHRHYSLSPQPSQFPFLSIFLSTVFFFLFLQWKGTAMDFKNTDTEEIIIFFSWSWFYFYFSFNDNNQYHNHNFTSLFSLL